MFSTPLKFIKNSIDSLTQQKNQWDSLHSYSCNASIFSVGLSLLFSLFFYLFFSVSLSLSFSPANTLVCLCHVQTHTREKNVHHRVNNFYPRVCTFNTLKNCTKKHFFFKIQFSTETLAFAEHKFNIHSLVFKTTQHIRSLQLLRRGAPEVIQSQLDAIISKNIRHEHMCVGQKHN